MAIAGDEGDVALYVNEKETPRLRLAPLTGDSGYVEVESKAVAWFGSAPERGLYCRFGHYVLPLDACRGHLVDEDAPARALEGAALVLPMWNWP